MIERGGRFPIIRTGIRDESLETRFGQIYWFEHEDGIKYSLILVERTPADEKPKMPWDLPGQIARTHLAHLMGVITELLDLLEEQGSSHDRRAGRDQRMHLTGRIS